MIEKTINSDPPAEGTWSDTINPTLANLDGIVSLSIVFAALAAMTITLQRSLDNELTWNDCVGCSFVGSEDNIFVDETAGNLYRIGCKAGDWVSGSALLRLKK